MHISRSARVLATGLTVFALSGALLPGTAGAAVRVGQKCTKVGSKATSPTGVGLSCSAKKQWAVAVQPTVPAPVATAPAALSKNAAACVTGTAPETDLFPDKARITDATGLSITYSKNYKVVRVPRPWAAAKSGFTYVLVQCGTKAPALSGDLSGATVIQVPVQRAAIMSTVYAPEFDAVGQADRIVSVDSPEYYSTPSVVKRIESGAIKGTGSGSSANVEMLVGLKPDVVMTYSTSAGSFSGVDKLISAGLPVVLEASYLEESPLGRAEWVKLVGALTNQEAKAESEYSRWRTDYKTLATRAAATKTRPVVISGSMFQGTWFMPGGKSFPAQLIRDAGGSYPWETDTTSGSIALDFEAVVSKAYDATVWINAGYLWNTMRDLVKEDARYARMNPYVTGNVFGNDKRVNDTGGSDYFETAVVRPDLVLKDLVSVLHPELVPDHSRIWYRQIPRS